MLHGGRLREVREAIWDEQYRFDMRTWVRVQECGTTACLAGLACLLAGDTPLCEGETASSVRTVSGEFRSVSGRAAELLGLSETQAGRLFFTLDRSLALNYLNHLIELADRDAE